MHLLMSDERIPVRCLLLSQVGMKHVISRDEVLEEKKGDVKSFYERVGKQTCRSVLRVQLKCIVTNIKFDQT